MTNVAKAPFRHEEYRRVKCDGRMGQGVRTQNAHAVGYYAACAPDPPIACSYRRGRQVQIRRRAVQVGCCGITAAGLQLRSPCRKSTLAQIRGSRAIGSWVNGGLMQRRGGGGDRSCLRWCVVNLETVVWVGYFDFGVRFLSLKMSPFIKVR